MGMEDKWHHANHRPSMQSTMYLNGTNQGCTSLGLIIPHLLEPLKPFLYGAPN
jgi:hypothetical protein